MVVSLTNTTEMSDAEKKVYYNERLQQVKQRTKGEAANFIMVICKLNMIKNRARLERMQSKKGAYQLAVLDEAYGGLRKMENIHVV